MTDCPNEVAAKTKPDISLIAPDFLLGLADVLTNGRGTHAARQWEDGMKWTLAYNSLQRHLLAWLGGEDTDPQSGKSHLDHAACRIMMLSSYAKRGLGEDDRPDARVREPLSVKRCMEEFAQRVPHCNDKCVEPAPNLFSGPSTCSNPEGSKLVKDKEGWEHIGVSLTTQLDCPPEKSDPNNSAAENTDGVIKLKHGGNPYKEQTGLSVRLTVGDLLEYDGKLYPIRRSYWNRAQNSPDYIIEDPYDHTSVLVINAYNPPELCTGFKRVVS